ncbi:MAG TPA: hypothetical protein VF386_07290, partial [Usitatibacter sp.]
AMALELLRAGDIFEQLRSRVRAVKPIAERVLRDAELEMIPNRDELPWLGVRDAGHRTAEYLESRGVFALRPTPTGRAGSRAAEVLRLTIPLSDERIAHFSRLLA